ncbi:MAG TPA: hypothetical protein VLG10_17430 [Methylomirabilota bacterium]|nr:hypothetical protein [Methylomirabilota bacterium]
MPLTITKFEQAPNRFGVEPLPVVDPKTGQQIRSESYRIDWRLDGKLPNCLSVDRFVVGYSIHGSLRQDVSVPGNTLSTVVNVSIVGTPSLAAAGRRSASVTGVLRSQLGGDIKHTFGGIPSVPSGACNQIPLAFDTNFAGAKLVVIQAPSSPKVSGPGGIVAKAPAMKFDSGRGLPVSWRLQPTNQQLCATLDKFNVSAKVTLTDGSVREGSTTAAPDAVSTIVPLLKVSPLTADQAPEIQRVEEVRVRAITKPSLNLSGSYRNF